MQSRTSCPESLRDLIELAALIGWGVALFVGFWLSLIVTGVGFIACLTLVFIRIEPSMWLVLTTFGASIVLWGTDRALRKMQ